MKCQSDLLNQKKNLHIDCKSTKEVLKKDDQKIVSDFCSMASYIKYFLFWYRIYKKRYKLYS